MKEGGRSYYITLCYTNCHFQYDKVNLVNNIMEATIVFKENWSQLLKIRNKSERNICIKFNISEVNNIHFPYITLHMLEKYQKALYQNILKVYKSCFIVIL